MNKKIILTLLSISYNISSFAYPNHSHHPYYNINDNSQNYTKIEINNEEKDKLFNAIRNSNIIELENILINYSNHKSVYKPDFTFPISSKIISDQYNKTIFHYVTDFKKTSEELETLLKYSDYYYYDFNKTDDFGNTPLFLACKNNNLKSVQLLLNVPEVVQNINVVKNKFKHPLYIAKENNNNEIEALLRQNGAFLPGEIRSSLLNNETSNITNQNKPNQNIQNNKNQFLEIFDIHEKNKLVFSNNAKNDLYNAVINNDSQALKNYLDIAKKYMDSSLNTLTTYYLPELNFMNDKENKTLIHSAVILNKENALKTLLSYKDIYTIDINKQDLNGNTPLHYSYYYQHTNLTNMLLQYGANKDIFNSDWKIPEKFVPSQNMVNDKNSIPQSINKSPTNLSKIKNVDADTSDSANNKDFQYKSLYRSNFSNKKLEDANFQFSYLQEAKFNKTKLAGSNFSSATLTYADLRGADLSGVNFTGADLSHANLTGANLSNADFTGAFLERTELTGIIISNYTKLPKNYNVIIQGDKQILLNENKVHKFVSASRFFKNCDSSGCSANNAPSAFEKGLLDAVEEQKKTRGKEFIKSNTPNSNSDEYETPVLEDLREKRWQHFKNKNLFNNK